MTKPYIVLLLIIAVWAPAICTAAECERTTAIWVCRRCGMANPMVARFCRRDRADLEAQRRSFRASLQPVLLTGRMRLIRGESTVLRWYTHCADEVRIEPGVGIVPAIGALRVRPTADTQYTLTAVSRWRDWITMPPPASVEVYPANPQVTIDVSPQTLISGESAKLRWDSRNATHITLEPGGRELAASGEILVSPARNTAFRIRAESEGSTPASAEAAVVVISKPELIPLPDSPDYEKLLLDINSIYFSEKEPRPEGTKALAPVEKVKLQRLAEILRVHPEMHVSLTAFAYEFWDGHHGFYEQHRALLSRRWSYVSDFMINQGVDPSQIVASLDGDRYQSVPKNLRRTKAAEVAARSVVIRFAGATPLLRAIMQPARVRADETSFLMWSARNTDRVEINPGGEFGPQGEMRLRYPSTYTYRVTATNRYGFQSVINLTLSLYQREIAISLPAIDPAAEVADNMPVVLFPHRSSVLTPLARNALDGVASWLMQPNHQLVRIGVRGTSANGPGSLARERAEACRKYLVLAGIDSKRVAVLPPTTPQSFDEVHADASTAFKEYVEISYTPATMIEKKQPIRRKPH